MRIAIFTDTFYPCINGVSASTLYFAEELVKRGHHIFIFCPRYKGSKNEEHDHITPGYSVYRCPAIPVPTNPEHRVTFPALGFGVNIKSLKLDVIHIQAPFVMGMYGAKIARKFNIPLTQTYHTLWEDYAHYFMMPKWLFQKFIVRQNRNLCNNSMVNFVPSPQIIEILKTRYGVTSKLVICPTGVDIKGFETNINQQLVDDHLGLPKDRRILLFASRMTREKAVDIVVKAFPKILKAVPDTMLVLSGEGPYESEIRNMVKQFGIADRVVIKGYLSRADLYAHYKVADLFVFPSTSETQGLVVLEAQYYGTPVVGVAKNGVAMLMENNKGGLLAKERDADEVADLCIQLLTDKKLYDAKSKEATQNALDWRTEKFALLMEEEILKAVERFNSTKKR